MKGISLLLCLSALSFRVCAQPNSYPWLATYDSTQSILARVPVPEGYRRANAPPGSFADWLRRLPLSQGRPPVRLFNGQEKSNQSAHAAVIDIDVGDKDLQQCADAVIRLRAEYLYSRQRLDSIRFSFTSGDVAEFRRWARGFRPTVSGNRVNWSRTARIDSGYASFREYLSTVFMYAGSYSLSRECRPLRGPETPVIGDIFIEGGFPGHAVILVDAAAHRETGKTLVLLAQSYMPAQDIHLLANPFDPGLDPWYEVAMGQELRTPEWIFPANSAKRLR